MLQHKAYKMCRKNLPKNRGSVDSFHHGLDFTKICMIFSDFLPIVLFQNMSIPTQNKS